MLNAAEPWQLALVLILVVLGVSLAVMAWKMATGPEQATARSEVLSAVGGGLVAGFAVGLSVLFLQNSFEESQREATWRANVEIAARIPGFDPREHSLEGITFNAKELPAANFEGRNLSGMEFRDANLEGATFRGANLRGADLTHANLSTADLTGANLGKAILLSANLGQAEMRKVSSLAGAQVNARTCWPPGFLQDNRMKQVKVKVVFDTKGNRLLGKGREGPCL
ncbi:pentapeptide repeat-containing protein [Streptomyces luteogriseus]